MSHFLVFLDSNEGVAKWLPNLVGFETHKMHQFQPHKRELRALRQIEIQYYAGNALLVLGTLDGVPKIACLFQAGFITPMDFEHWPRIACRLQAYTGRQC